MGFVRRGWIVLLLVCLVGSSLSHFSDAAVEVISEDSGAGGRSLLQNTLKECPEQYFNFNFTPVLEACPSTPNTTDLAPAEKTKCCKSLCRVLGANGSYINDPTYDCAERFFDYLSLAGNYVSGYFAYICTDTNNAQGIYCSPADIGAPPTPPAGNGGTEINSILWNIFLALGIFEALILVI